MKQLEHGLKENSPEILRLGTYLPFTRMKNLSVLLEVCLEKWNGINWRNQNLRQELSPEVTTLAMVNVAGSKSHFSHKWILPSKLDCSERSELDFGRYNGAKSRT